ncbi:MAG: dCTP deaminase [Halobacteriales archaeon]|nr:dCTP deaminase [Halobacteriales archaeon]
MTSVQDLQDALDGIVHADTQVGELGIDLTVGEIYDIDGPGRIDFGGGELEPAELSAHDRTWRNPDDDYQWWHLDDGQYLIEYNETLTGDTIGVLEPRPAMLERGVAHPTVHVQALPRMPLAVGAGGVRIKENARISRLMPGSA